MTAPLAGDTLTFLFTDIEGSTRRWEERTKEMRLALATHDSILRTAIEGNQGTVFKTVGDAFYAAFSTAPDALAAAVDAQYALQAEEWGAVGPLRVRIALHTGAVELRDGDYFGPPLNRVARLLSARHGGQVLLSEATASLVRDVLFGGMPLRDKGEHRLKDLQRPERIFQLVANGLAEDFPSLRTLDTRPNNLPAQATPFIGREALVERVKTQLLRPDVRLLTLLGPGGTGKTRLSVQAVAELLEEFPDGVFFVPLAPVTDHSLVAPAVLQAVGARQAEGRSAAEAAKEHLRDKHVLLVLDNLEQLTGGPASGAGETSRGGGGAAGLVADLLGACGRLKVLVTSRSALRVYGEQELPVLPLALPDPRHLPAVELTQFEAVRLFIERARAVKPDFQVTNENAPAVAEVCFRLDGLPLAIELAAARVRLLTPQAMLGRLQHRLSLLTGGSRDLPARQQTLRGAIDWSFDLLEPDEQALFRRLAVFSGGCTMEDAEAVCGAALSGGAADVLDGVESLVSKSLLRQEEAEDGEIRFFMLATIREYALERLSAAGELEPVRREHAEHFLTVAEEAQPKLQSAEQSRWLDRLETEHDNFRAALAWVIERADDPDATQIGLRLCAPLFWFWQLRGHWKEGHTWIEDVLALPHAAARTVARARSLSNCGIIDGMMGEVDEAEEKLLEALEIFREQGDRAGEADALVRLGYAALNRPDLDLAGTRYAESLRISRETGNRVSEATALMGQGNLALERGEFDRAAVWYQEALVIRRGVGDRWGLGQTLSSLAELHARQEQYGHALATLEEALTLYLQLRSNGNVAMIMADLAGYFLPKEDRAYREHALSLLGAAVALYEAVGFRFGPDDLAEHDHRLASLPALLADPGLRAHFERGRAMSPEEAVRFAVSEHPVAPAPMAAPT